jgi:hypothetical protein
MDPKTGVVELSRACTRHSPNVFQQRWQAAVTYTLSGLWNGDPLPLSGLKMVTFGREGRRR